MANNKQMMQAILFEQKKRNASGSLYEFVRQSWHVVEPGIPFIESWHIERICEHLEAVSAGDITRLLINIPPRHSKSTIVSVMWPAWEWLTDPTTKYLCASYSATLSIRDNLKTRRLLQSPWFQARWSHMFKFSGDQNAKQRFENDKTGYRIATSVGGTATGEGGNRLICLHENSYIMCEQGPIKIKDLVDSQLDTRVLAFDHANSKPVYADILRYEVSEGRKSFKLITDNGEITATHDHPVYVVGVGYVPLEGVKQGDRLLRCVWERVESETKPNSSRKKFCVRKGMWGRSEATVSKHCELSGVRKRYKKNTSPRSSNERRDMLQPYVSWNMDERASTEGRSWLARRFMHNLRNNYSASVKQEEKSVLLFKEMWRQRIVNNEIRTQGCKELFAMWRRVFRIASANGAKENMLKKVRWPYAQQIAKRREQRAIHSWQSNRALSVGVSSCGKRSAREGLQYMPMVWDEHGEAWENSRCASHRLQQRKQQYRQPYYALPVLSRDNARELSFTTELVEDIVVGIEEVETPGKVYNVAINTHHNYFANGLLLHNCDDPHSAQAAQSDVIRGSDLEWFDQVWSTRLNNPKEDAMIVVMQRLHEKDISGHILEDIGGWEHICIPAEWDGEKRKTSLGVYDERETIGELICPERFGAKEIQNLKKLLGQYGSAGQLQQTPSPAEGGILKTKYFNLWPAAKGLPQFEFILQSYDCAFTEKSTGDPTACSVWAVFTYQNARQVMLIDAWDDHLSYPELRKRAINDWTTEYGGMSKDSPFSRARRPDCILVEAKASGQSLIQDLRLARVPVVGYNPGNADKVSRAHQSAPTLEAGLLWIPESSKNLGHSVTWAQRFIKQLDKFPVADHDDYVDTFSQAIIYLKNDGWFDLQQAKDVDGPRLKKKEHTNPYAA
jgi:predicted phage terminase large subunit-like protein